MQLNVHRVATSILSVLATIAVAAQMEPITIRLVPASNQLVRLHSLQEMMMDMPAMPGMAVGGPLVSKTESVYTMRVGAPNGEGLTELQFTIDTLNAETSINGQHLPLPVPPGVAGLTLISTVDKDGKIIDIKLPSDNPAMAAAMKSLLSSAVPNPLTLTLAVGQTTTVPADIAIPLPAGAGGSSHPRPRTRACP